MQHRIEFVVDGESKPITEQEAKVALEAVIAYRRSQKRAVSKRDEGIRERRDKECWELLNLGYSYQEIGRELGVTVRTVKGAIGRIENGRYGDVVVGG